MHCKDCVLSKRKKRQQREEIIPQEVNRQVNAEGEEYAMIKTPDGEYYTVRGGVVFDAEGFDKGKPPAVWIKALGISQT